MTSKPKHRTRNSSVESLKNSSIFSTSGDSDQSMEAASNKLKKSSTNKKSLTSQSPKVRDFYQQLIFLKYWRSILFGFRKL